METEEWKVIEGYSRYAVSNLRRVKNTQTNKYVGHRNNTTPGSKDVVLLLSDADEYHTFTIERLYGMCFGYEPPCLPGEEWRDSLVHGVLVSNLGRLFSTFWQRLIQPTAHQSGYLVFRRKNVGSWKVHRLVAAAFLPADPARPHVDHINEDRHDNRACNLRWCTREENNAFYAERHPQGT